MQLNNQELDEFVEGELAENPLLEKAEKEPETEAQDNPEKDDIDQNFQEDFKPAFDASSADAKIGAGGNTSFERLVFCMKGAY